MYMPVYITYGESVKFELAVQELLPVLQYMIWHLSTTGYYIYGTCTEYSAGRDVPKFMHESATYTTPTHKTHTIHTTAIAATRAAALAIHKYAITRITNHALAINITNAPHTIVALLGTHTRSRIGGSLAPGAAGTSHRAYYERSAGLGLFRAPHSPYSSPRAASWRCPCKLDVPWNAMCQCI